MGLAGHIKPPIIEWIARLAKLDMLRDEWQDCASCKLHQTRKQIVMYRGSLLARVFLIGEGPGRDEDEQGMPFVGAAGQKLDELLEEAGLDVQSKGELGVFIANMVACRPPNNRDPERDELSTCAPRLQYMLRVVRPKVLVLLGRVAAKLAGIHTISQWRGELSDVEMVLWNGKLASWPAIPTYHPSYLLRSGNNRKIRRQIVSDLRVAKSIAYG